MTEARYVLTLSCPDRTGIVAAVSGFIARHNGLITEVAHFVDARSERSFLRTAFEGEALPPRDELEERYSRLASEFGMDWLLHDAGRRCRVLVAVSRQGHCLYNLLHRWRIGTLPVDVVGVVSNHLDHGDLVDWYDLPFHHLPIEDGDKPAQEARLLALFDTAQCDLLVLARYMQVLSPAACRNLAGRAINIHHSFLPGFKGARPYHQAYERGVKIIGATAHFVTDDLDEGPIIEQGVERVDHSMGPDEMITIGHDLESMVPNRAVRWFAEHRVFRSGQRTVVLRS